VVDLRRVSFGFVAYTKVILHINDLLEITFLQQWKESASYPVDTRHVVPDDLLKVFPNRID
jgi:hypothetical protein